MHHPTLLERRRQRTERQIQKPVPAHVKRSELRKARECFLEVGCSETDVTEVNGPSVGGRLGLDEVRTVPAVSAANGLVYIANRRNDTYEYFAADWETGEKKATWLFPNDSVLWNNWGGITVFLPDGDFFIGWLLRSQALRYGCYEVVVATRNTESYVVT